MRQDHCVRHLEQSQHLVVEGILPADVHRVIVTELLVGSAEGEFCDVSDREWRAHQSSETVVLVWVGLECAAIAGVVKGVVALGADGAVRGKAREAGVVAEVQV